MLLVPFVKSTGLSFIAECFTGIMSKQCPSTKLLNYFIIIGKLFLWDCRRNQIKPKIQSYQNKITTKYETERNKKRIMIISKKKMDI